MNGKKETSEPDVTVYRPHQRHELGLFGTWRVMGRNIIGSRELIWQLFKRDFLATYKKSFLGITWIFLSPLFGIVSWVFLHSTGMLKPGDLDIPYPAYVLVGTSIWGLFTGFFNSAKATLMAGSSLILQVNYPHEAMLFKETAQHLAAFAISFLMNLLVLFVFGVIPGWKIIFFPVVIIPLFLLGAGIGLIFSMISIVAVDLNRISGMGISLLMWLTPVIYSDQVTNPIVRIINEYNPLTYLVCSARDIIIYGRLYHAGGFFICAILSLMIFLISWRLFFVSENQVIERML